MAAPGNLGFAGAPGEADDRSPGMGIPVRAAETGERRHQEHTTGRGALRGQLLEFRRVVDDPEAVPQPLDGRSGSEHRASRA